MKTIPGYDNYTIDEKGNIFNKDKALLKPWNNRGYRQVSLYKNGIRKSQNVHRLMALTYLPDYYEKPQVNHINGNKVDNRLENLEMCTHIENSVHAKESGLLRPARGEKAGSSKLTQKQVDEIRSKYVRIKYSSYKLSLEYNVSQQTISDIILNKIWKRST